MTADRAHDITATPDDITDLLRYECSKCGFVSFGILPPLPCEAKTTADRAQVDVAGLRELEEAATEGPWWAVVVPAPWLRHRDPEDASWTVDSGARMVVLDTGWFKDPQAEQDAAFIAAARNALPALLDEVQRLRAQVAAVEALAEEWAKPVSEVTGAGVLGGRQVQVTTKVRNRRQWHGEAIRAALEQTP